MDNTKHIFFRIAKILFVSFSVFLVLFVLLIVVITFGFRKNIVQVPPAISPETSQFANCKSLSKNCASDSCQYYNLCQSANSDYRACKVYDCASSYGIEITTKNNELLAKSFGKVNVVKAKENIAACQGTVKIISNKCEKNVGIIKVEVATAGKCSVEAFVFKQDGQFNSAVFNNLGNNFYQLNIPSCKTISDISAIGSGGYKIGTVLK